MATSSVASALGQNSPAASSTIASNSLNGLQPSDFLNMLLTELQNQDPLSPMDSGQMLTQIGQISQLSSTQTLTSTLNSMATGQNLSNATALIGKTVDGIDDSGAEITGAVDQVTVANNVPVLNIGTDTMQLGNVKSVSPDSTANNIAQDAVLTAENTASTASQLQQLLQIFQQAQPTTNSQSNTGGSSTSTGTTS